MATSQQRRRSPQLPLGLITGNLLPDIGELLSGGDVIAGIGEVPDLTATMTDIPTMFAPDFGSEGLTLGSEFMGEALPGTELGSMPLGGTEFFSGGPLGAAAGIAGAYTLYDLWRDKVKGTSGALRGAMGGAGVGTAILPGIGTAVGALLGGLGGSQGFWRSGKDPKQLGRDKLRAALQEQGFLDKDYNITLADGTTYNMGKDGRTRPFEPDMERANIDKAIAYSNPLGFLMSGGNEELHSSTAGYFANAATGSGDYRENIKKMYKDMKAEPDAVRDAIRQAQKEGKLAEDTANIYLHDLDELFGTSKAAPASPTSTEGATPTEGVEAFLEAERNMMAEASKKWQAANQSSARKQMASSLLGQMQSSAGITGTPFAASPLFDKKAEDEDEEGGSRYTRRYRY